MKFSIFALGLSLSLGLSSCHGLKDNTYKIVNSAQRRDDNVYKIVENPYKVDDKYKIVDDHKFTPNYIWEKSKCSADEFETKVEGCIKSCAGHNNWTCSKYAYLTKYNNVCGYDEFDKKWRDYDNKCDACDDSRNVGYKTGKCAVTVDDDDHYDQDVQLEDLSYDQKYPRNKICKPFYIYTKARGCIKSCKHPDFSKCPVALPFTYQDKFCALNQDGKWNNQSSACEACSKYKYGLHYKNIGVSNGKCRYEADETPEDNNTDYCRKDRDCLWNEKCQDGECVDLCENVTCGWNEKCEDGQCVRKNKPNRCWSDYQCETNQECEDGKCVEKQQRERCGYTYCRGDQKCKRGVCVDIQTTYDRCESCKSSEICTYSGKCVDLCAFLRCSNGSVCENGKCVQVKDQCAVDSDCLYDETCERGVCKSGCCSTIKCGYGKSCEHGKCVDDKYDNQLNKWDHWKKDWKSKYEQIDSGETIYCRRPRPTFKACPYEDVKEEYMNYCVIDQSGNRKSFAKQCEICRDSTISSYARVKCYKNKY